MLENFVLRFFLKVDFLVKCRSSVDFNSWGFVPVFSLGLRVFVDFWVILEDLRTGAFLVCGRKEGGWSLSGVLALGIYHSKIALM